MNLTPVKRKKAEKNIKIKGAKMHNLKNIDVEIPRNKFVVVTGLSGSGKSSLAFDTLYAEGQRRYVESLSAYARQFMGKLNKPEVDNITGISPAIAIEQKVNSKNPRSTVGTTTEIYDYLKLLYARIGRTFSPVSGEEVKQDTVSSTSNEVLKLKPGTKFLITCPLESRKDQTVYEHIHTLKKQGFTRVYKNGKLTKIDDYDAEGSQELPDLVIDRLSVKDDDDTAMRLADSLQTAFYEGNGTCFIDVKTNEGFERRAYSNKFELDGIEFEKPTLHFFAFNNPLGACKTCEGFGSVMGIDADLVIPNKTKSVYEDAVVCWKGEKMSKWKDELIRNADKFDFPIHRPITDLTEDQLELLWTGNSHFKGLNKFFAYLEKKSYKIQYRVMLSRYRGRTACPDCKGTRLRKDAGNVKVNGKSIIELVLSPIDELAAFFNELPEKLTAYDNRVAKRILIEIQTRLQFLTDVGLSYLTLNRTSGSLSGGESQRINLATTLGSSLVGSMYILDEPSIGLHPRDTQRLIKVLTALKKAGNTVIVVEHEEEIMRAADQIIDLGPGAGSLGGDLIFSGTFEELEERGRGLTADYLTGKRTIETPEKRRTPQKYITVKGARHHNLKNFDVDIPLNCLVVISGVSGSGKSSLVKNILYPALRKELTGYSEQKGDFDKLAGKIDSIDQVEFIDQNPIGKSSRSNPVTYVKAFDEIRALMAAQKAAKIKNYKPSTFSFNVDGGRCDNCKGDGTVTIEMQFMADIHLVCEDCKGKRYKDEVLEINYRGKNIYDILDMTIDDAIAFFNQEKENLPQKIVHKLLPLQEVGLGYVKLGQSSGTLSGGEAQRIKLASFLSKGTAAGKTLFIFDEPTTGLHFHDISKLLTSFNALIDNGHTVLVIEHNVEVIKSADYVIDLGPEGGKNGGNLLFAGTPEALVKCDKSITGEYVKKVL